MVEPISAAIIVSTLVAAATKVAEGISGDALKDAYQGLKTLLKRRFGDDAGANVALEKIDKEPTDAWKSVLKEKLEATGAVQDTEVQSQARHLQETLEKAGFAVSVSGQGNVVAGHDVYGAATGQGAVAAGRDISNSLVTTGNNNTIGQPEAPRESALGTTDEAVVSDLEQEGDTEPRPPRRPSRSAKRKPAEPHHGPRNRGFGFITPEGAQARDSDVFFHSSEVQIASFDELQGGESVTFDQEPDPRDSSHVVGEGGARTPADRRRAAFAYDSEGQSTPPTTDPALPGLDVRSSSIAPPITCHFRGEMDKTVRIGRVTTLEVTVSREVIGGEIDAAAQEQSVPVDPSRQLIIQVLPKANVEVVGESRADIAPPGPEDPRSLYFDIRPTDLGRAQVWVVVRQGQVPLTTLKLAARVVKTTSRASVRDVSESVATEAPPLAEPLHQLRISQRESGGHAIFSFELESPKLRILGQWESQRIAGNAQEYVSSLYTRIEERWLSTNRDVEAFTEELREFGGELLDELVPAPLQQILWDNRHLFTSIQVLGDEPLIPWELVHLKAPGQPLPDETCFLGQMGMVRWLYDGGFPPTQLLVRPGRSRYVIPNYPEKRYELPETVEERKFLETTFGATAVEPQPTPVRKLLATPGAFDLLHFACHGAAESDNITGAHLLLEGRCEDGEYKREHLTATTVEQRSNFRAPDGVRPMVVLNACQAARAGYRLTGIGGFAQAFLKRQAGAFVGTLWSVGDAPARVFTETFYTQLLAAKQVSEAAVVAREQARADGDATWLAYVVYAHPHATLTR